MATPTDDLAQEAPADGTVLGSPTPARDGNDAPETSAAELDRAVAALAEAALGFARTPPREKAAVLRALLPALLEVAPAQVDAACAAKGIDPTSPTAGEEWLAGPCVTLANVRLLADALEDIAASGRPRLGRRGARTRPDGRVLVDVLPGAATDALLYAGLRADALIEAGATADSVAAAQARHYQEQDPQGGVSLVLGAGNVASIPPMDALHKLFVEGRVVLLKMSPVNAYLGPSLERALAPLIDRGWLRIVYGGADVGAHLVARPEIGDLHITGSAAAHDRIVWGAPGPEQARSKAAGRPLLEKPISSELGNISPVLVTPFLYGEDELWYQARNLAAQLVNNASFNCNAAKLLVLPRGFAQRGLLLDMLIRALSAVPPRRAYYPGAHARHAALTADRPRLPPQALTGKGTSPLPRGVVLLGDAAPDALPWTLIAGLDPADPHEPLLSTEPFCGILSLVEIGSDDPIEFFAEATRFCNDRVWGTLCVSLLVPPAHDEDPALVAALDKAILDLRYGAIAVNQWPAFVYAAAAPPWGGHPSASLSDVQSGLGFVHNTSMLGRVEKVLLRGPLRAFPRPPIFPDHRRAHLVGQRLARYAAAPGWGAAARVAAEVVRG